ncbi:hypothetical protein [Streptacidiphilus sp. BW17]|uniref:hypothetical protein n=1 Tax=Streptacidiphilus sp. BW17 TaxID=3156274 RepID=UPI003511908C
MSTSARDDHKPRSAWLALAGLAVAGSLLSGCSSPATAPAKAPATSAPARPEYSAPAAAPSTAPPSLSSAGALAEAVQAQLLPQLDADGDRFGTGTGSPCSTSKASVFTAACEAAAKAIGQDTSQALSAISGKSGFATLRRVATQLQQAVTNYEALGCGLSPSSTSIRQQCLPPAALIAQGVQDLQDGVNLALAGR